MVKNKEQQENQENIVVRPRNNFMDIIGHNDNKGLDAMAEKLTDVLFSKEKLLMTARLTKDYALMIIRNSIVSKFFIGYYANCKAEISLNPISVPPYYIKNIEYTIPNKDKAFQHIMKELNEELLQITIGFDGKGRQELTEIVSSVVRNFNQEKDKLGLI